MLTVVPSGKYTLNASEKTITLSDPYNGITAEQIISIRNLSIGVLIYDCASPKKQTITINPAGTINYSYDASMTSNDIIQIAVDLPYVSVIGIDGGTP